MARKYKTDWKYGDAVTEEELNRMENNVKDIDEETADTGWKEFYISNEWNLKYRKIGKKITLKGTCLREGSNHAEPITLILQTEMIANLLPNYEFNVNNSRGDFESFITINNEMITIYASVGEHNLNNISWLID